MIALRGIGHLFAANARMFFRVRQEIFWVFFLPVFLLILLGPVLKDMAGIGSLRPEDVNFPVGVIDKDCSQASREFIRRLQSASEFTITALDENEAMGQALTSEQRVVVVFPAGFEEALERSEAEITVITDARALPLTGMAYSLLREKVDAIMSELAP